MSETFKFPRDENIYSKSDLDNALELLYENDKNNVLDDDLTRENVGIEYSIIYRDSRFAVKLVYDQMRKNKTGKGLRNEISGETETHPNSKAIRKILSQFYECLPGIEYPDEEKKKLQQGYKDFLNNKYKEQYEKDSSLLSDPFYAYQENNKSIFRKYGVYFWKILDNERNMQRYENALVKVFDELGHKREMPFPPGHARNYYRKFLVFKEFLDTKYGGYINWIRQKENKIEKRKYYVVSQTDYYLEHKEKGILRSTAKKEHRRVRELKPNDVILSFNDGMIKDIITVKNLPIIDETNNSITVKVEYNEIPQDKILTRKDIRIKIPSKLYFEMTEPDFPFCKPNGEYDCKIKQRGYLFYFSKECFDMLTNGINTNFISKITQPELIDTKNGEKSMTQPLNQILYGPPGTGKTYNTVVKAIQILDVELYKKYDAYLDELKKSKDFKIPKENSDFADYKMLQKRYNQLKEQGRIEFITFHQSYSYEEFVEGIKPYIPKAVWKAENIDKIELPEVKYLGKKGVFREICDRAANLYFDEAINIFKELHPQGSDFENLLSLDYEKEENKIYFNYGQSKTNQQRFFPLEHLKHYYDENVIFEKPEDLYNKMLDDFQYKIKLQSYNFTFYNKLLRIKEENKYKPYVLIIDEINRGNISKIFGELITLIEEDKRAGEDNAITVTLPYSGETFSVPNNLYIIGTMNTSDRSIASVDIALRRRFKFVEMMPNSDLVTDFGLTDEKDKFKDYFEKMNKKISILLDRDHQIGHSYFINTKYNNENENNNIETLKQIWFDSIIPLLNEYFYGDWDKLQAILGVAKKEDAFIKPIEIDKSFENNKFFKENCENENCFEFANLNDFNDNEKFKKALKNMDAETEQ